MERVIKFRGKTLNGEWVYGNLLKLADGYIIIPIFNEFNKVPDNSTPAPLMFYENDFYVVYPNTVGQFTGLCDKNGKEIYEGDIVRWHNQNYAIVFKYGQFYASIEKCHKNVYGGFPLHSLADTLITIDENNICEIIGNIYDNHELLKGNEK